MTMEILDAAAFARAMRAAVQALADNEERINALNVFPVPDGDTGTNMFLTLRSAEKELELGSADSLGAVADQVAMGCLMGARGNSGVILSQLFRGLARCWEGMQETDADGLAAAMQCGVETAYKSVMKPVEGTILTVAREGALSARQAAEQGADVLGVMQAACEGAERALQRTPEMLAVLKKAGVVDAGGQGLVVILEGAQRELRQTAERPVADLAPRQSKVDFHLPPELEEIEFPYDIQLLLIGDGLEAEELREQLLPLGDCVLVVGTPQMLKIHIHTDNPAPVMEACVQRGEMRSIEILNMREQQEALLNGAEQAPAPVADNDIGIVAVASGDGLTEVLRSLGAHEIVTGGQTMNPSTKDLLRAVQQVPSQNVIILPNNKNVILAAEQVVGLTDKRVMVVPSRSVPQGIMALMSLRPDLELEAAVQRMTNACSQVQTGEVTYAVRDSHLEDNDIQAGDILGIVNGHIAVVGKDPGDVLQEMVANMVNADTAVITLYYGSDVALAEAQARQEALANSYPDLEVELVRGGQPLYYYIVAVE